MPKSPLTGKPVSKEQYDLEVKQMKAAEKAKKEEGKLKMLVARAKGDEEGAAAAKAGLAVAKAAKHMSSAEAFQAEQMKFIDENHRHDHHFYRISRSADWKGEDKDSVHRYLMGPLRFMYQPKDAPGEKDINLFVGDCTYKWWNGKVETTTKKDYILEVHPGLLKSGTSKMGVEIPDGSVVAVRSEQVRGQRIGHEAGSLAYGAAVKLVDMNILHHYIVAVIPPGMEEEYLAQNMDESRIRRGLYDTGK
jgi:hypothetical protein